MKPRVFFIGSGVGKVFRGFESHIQDLYEHLKDETAYEAHLIKATGTSQSREHSVSSFSGSSRTARFLGFVFKRNPLTIQQMSFFAAFIFEIVRHKPDLLYLGEPVLFNLLYRWRRFSKAKFKMIFFTGGNTVPLKMDKDDFLQLVTPALTPLALSRKILEKQMKVIPHFVNALKKSPASKNEVRKELGLPLDRLIILSVGAIDTSIKRMNYVIDEISRMKPTPFLIMLGEHGLESDSVKQLAEERLGQQNFLINRVVRNKLSLYYDSADIFVLASLNEGFGMVNIEALHHGLPVISHTYPNAQFVLENMATYGDLSEKNALSRCIEQITPTLNDPALEIERKNYIDRKFSWKGLSAEYKNMFLQQI